MKSHSTEVLEGLRRLVQALREGSRAAELEVGLSGAQLFVLKAVGEAPSLSLNDVAARTRTHQSTVSAVVSRLVKDGYLKRARSEDDARRLELRLTPKGARRIANAPHTPQDRLIAAVEKLPAAQRKQLAAGLTRVAELMALPRPTMFFEEGRTT
ncbi:MAG: MarR family transcriptional regulator [Archangium sp.]